MILVRKGTQPPLFDSPMSLRSFHPKNRPVIIFVLCTEHSFGTLMNVQIYIKIILAVFYIHTRSPLRVSLITRYSYLRRLVYLGTKTKIFLGYHGLMSAMTNRGPVPLVQFLSRSIKELSLALARPDFRAWTYHQVGIIVSGLDSGMRNRRCQSVVLKRAWRGWSKH